MQGQYYRTWAVIGVTDSSFTPHLSRLKLSWKEGYQKVDTFLNGIIFAEGYFTISPFLIRITEHGPTRHFAISLFVYGLARFLLLVSLRIFDTYLVGTHRTMLSGAVMHQQVCFSHHQGLLCV